MPDKRAYFKLDVGYMSNPKVLTVMDESPTAIILHVASIGYAAQHLTDGLVPIKALLRMTGATQADADLLYAAGLWNDGPDGTKAHVHDYLQHQRSAAEVKGASEAGKRGAKARWDADRNAPSNAPSNADRMRTAMGDASESAMPREEREEREETFSSAADAADPERADARRLCDLLADCVEANGIKRPKVTKRWMDSARLAMDSDGFTEAQLEWLIRRATADEFWRPNILSMPKLRDKAPTLKLKFANVRALPGVAVDGNGERIPQPGDPDFDPEDPRTMSRENAWMRQGGGRS